jgi:hypothetical protein
MTVEAMKKALTTTLVLALLFALVWALVSFEESQRSAWNRIKNPETVQKLKQFVTWKKAQAYADTNGVPPGIETMFQQAERGDWLALSNSVQEINWQIDDWQNGWHWHGLRLAVKEFIRDAANQVRGNRDYRMPPTWRGASGGAIMEVHRAFGVFSKGNEAYSAKYGREIIGSMPSGSIYFGGTDPGFFLVTVMCQPQLKDTTLFTISQNELNLDYYLDGLRATYQERIYLPTEADSEKCLQTYRDELEERTRNQTFSYEGSRMGYQGLLLQLILAKNPGHEALIELDYPIERIQSNLEPHGLIFKLNRQPVDKLSDEILQRDHVFWTNEIQPMIGGWLHDETSLQEVAAFAKKTFGRGDLNGFTGDTNFIKNAYSQSMFSKSRSAIAGLYDWRAQHANDAAEKKRMAHAADFAFKQAWALCPFSLEAVYRYVNFLLAQNRIDDALFLAETSAGLPQAKANEGLLQLPSELKQWRAEHPPAHSN